MAQGREWRAASLVIVLSAVAAAGGPAPEVPAR